MVPNVVQIDYNPDGVESLPDGSDYALTDPFTLAVRIRPYIDFWVPNEFRLGTVPVLVQVRIRIGWLI